MSKIRNGLLACLLVLPGICAPAYAHHSFAAFDMDKTVQVSGTVSRYEWTNPHVWIWLTPEAGGEEFGIEGHAIGNMLRQGWAHDSIKVGDKILAQVHPRKDGAQAGSYISVTLPDGTVLPPKMPGSP